MSRQHFGEAVNMGMKDATVNGQVGGRYTPATPTSPATFSTTLAIVNPKWKDRDGKLQETKETIYVTVFNPKDGSIGFADHYAKFLPVGKRLKNLEVERRQYMTQAKGPSGELLVKPDGTPFMIQKESYTLLRADLGRDSSKQVENEIAAWLGGKGELNFTSRPPFWNGAPGHLIALGRVTLQEADNGKKLWEQVSNARKNTHYAPGMTMFGYASVNIKAGMQQPVQMQYPNVAGGIPGFGAPAGFVQQPAAAPTSMADFNAANMPPDMDAEAAM